MTQRNRISTMEKVKKITDSLFGWPCPLGSSKLEEIKRTHTVKYLGLRGRRKWRNSIVTFFVWFYNYLYLFKCFSARN